MADTLEETEEEVKEIIIKERSFGTIGILLCLIFLIVGVVGGYSIKLNLQELLGSNQEIVMLTGKIQALKEQVSAVTPDLSKLQEAITTLEVKIKSLSLPQPTRTVATPSRGGAVARVDGLN